MAAHWPIEIGRFFSYTSPATWMVPKRSTRRPAFTAVEKSSTNAAMYNSVPPMFARPKFLEPAAFAVVAKRTRESVVPVIVRFGDGIRASGIVPLARLLAFTRSVSIFAVIVAPKRSPTAIARAVDDSCARALNVTTSPATPDTRAISAFALLASLPVGQMVALNGGVGRFAPSPVPSVSVKPLVAGDGATSTVPHAKFL